MSIEERIQAQDGMRIHWDAAIRADDGLVLRADVFRPMDEGRYPAILTYGPYGKGLAFQEGNKAAWERLVAAHPEVLEGSSNKYQSWELVDPEKWVPDGYAVVRVDSAAPGARPASSTRGLRARRRISMTASSGPRLSRGAAAR